MPVPTNLTREPIVASTSTSKNIWIAAGEGDLDRVKQCIEQEGEFVRDPEIPGIILRLIWSLCILQACL